MIIGVLERYSRRLRHLRPRLCTVPRHTSRPREGGKRREGSAGRSLAVGHTPGRFIVAEVGEGEGDSSLSLPLTLSVWIASKNTSSSSSSTKISSGVVTSSLSKSHLDPTRVRSGGSNKKGKIGVLSTDATRQTKQKEGSDRASCS